MLIKMATEALLTGQGMNYARGLLKNRVKTISSVSISFEVIRYYLSPINQKEKETRHNNIRYK
jgi:hypothetical protein